MRIGICDDDVEVLSSLSAFISSTYDDVLVDKYSSGEALLTSLKTGASQYDVLLLDIEMQGMDGIRVAKTVRRLLPDARVVFITSHDELAMTGYEVAAFRFLAKPIQRPKLIEAIAAVQAELLNMKTIQVRSGGVETIVKVKDIVCVEAQDKMVKITTRTQVLHDGNGIDHYARLLKDDDFCRVHRSYLVSFRHVKSIDSRDVRLTGGVRVPISRLRRTQFDDAFRSWVTRTAR